MESRKKKNIGYLRSFLTILSFDDKKLFSIWKINFFFILKRSWEINYLLQLLIHSIMYYQFYSNKFHLKIQECYFCLSNYKFFSFISLFIIQNFLDIFSLRDIFGFKLTSKSFVFKNNVIEVKTPYRWRNKEKEGRVVAGKGWCKFLTRRTILFPISSTTRLASVSANWCLPPFKRETPVFIPLRKRLVVPLCTKMGLREERKVLTTSKVFHHRGWSP